jgi:hypothetical protein
LFLALAILRALVEEARLLKAHGSTEDTPETANGGSGNESEDESNVVEENGDEEGFATTTNSSSPSSSGAIKCYLEATKLLQSSVRPSF